MGLYIVEYEQHGQDRAQYGERLLPMLAAELKKGGSKVSPIATSGLAVLFIMLIPRFG
jgi:hypothetical protein